MGGPQLYALTTPLLTKASGEKMGKSASGAVWLNEDLFSPYDFWQYFRNAEDADVGKWLKIFTRLPLDDIARLEKLEGAELNEAKKVLATEATAVVHGREAAEQAASTAAATFEAGALDLSLPTADITRSDLAAGIGIQAALVQAGLAASNGEARRHVQSGARINDELISDERTTLGTAAVPARGRDALRRQEAPRAAAAGLVADRRFPVLPPIEDAGDRNSVVLDHHDQDRPFEGDRSDACPEVVSRNSALRRHVESRSKSLDAVDDTDGRGRRRGLGKPMEY